MTWAILKNLTPHAIHVRTERGDYTFSPSGQVARVAVTQEVIGDVVGIPIVKSAFGEVEGLPEPQPDTMYIVSTIVAQAVSGRADVVAPDTGATAIRGADGRIEAVVRFQKF